MALGKKTGGRQKGTPNKRTLATDRQREQLRKEGIDPKDYIIGVLNGDDYDEIRYKAALDLMEFYYPKLSRTEMKAKVEITEHEAALKDLE